MGRKKMSGIFFLLAAVGFTIFLYAIGVVILGLAIFPGIYFLYQFWVSTTSWVCASRLLLLSFGLIAAYFFFGFWLWIHHFVEGISTARQPDALQHFVFYFHFDIPIAGDGIACLFNSACAVPKAQFQQNTCIDSCMLHGIHPGIFVRDKAGDLSDGYCKLFFVL